MLARGHRAVAGIMRYAWARLHPKAQTLSMARLLATLPTSLWFPPGHLLRRGGQSGPGAGAGPGAGFGLGLGWVCWWW